MATHTPRVVECHALSCGYSASDPVVKDVDMSVRPAEIVAILGGSGSGKSTLLRTICGLLPPLAGSALLLGEDPYALDGRSRRRVMRRTGMLFQHDALFRSMSILDNIA